VANLVGLWVDELAQLGSHKFCELGEQTVRNCCARNARVLEVVAGESTTRQKLAEPVRRPMVPFVLEDCLFLNPT